MDNLLFAPDLLPEHKLRLADALLWTVRLGMPAEEAMARLREAIEAAVAAPRLTKAQMTLPPMQAHILANTARSLEVDVENGRRIEQEAALKRAQADQLAQTAHPDAKPTGLVKDSVLAAAAAQAEPTRHEPRSEPTTTYVSEYPTAGEAISAHVAKRLHEIREQGHQDEAGKTNVDNVDTPKRGFREAKRIRTPKGEFASMGQAAKAYGVSLSAVSLWMKNGRGGFSFVGDEPAPEPVAQAVPVVSAVVSSKRRPRTDRRGMLIATPDGDCTVDEAVELYGITKTAAKQRADHGRFGWSWKQAAPKQEPQAPVTPKRGVRTPQGVFDSVEAAANHYGYTQGRISHVVEQGMKGWGWVETDGAGQVLRELGLGQAVEGVVSASGVFSSPREAALERIAA